jgi:hypothetical protein
MFLVPYNNKNEVTKDDPRYDIKTKNNYELIITSDNLDDSEVLLKTSSDTYVSSNIHNIRIYNSKHRVAISAEMGREKCFIHGKYYKVDIDTGARNQLKMINKKFHVCGDEKVFTSGDYFYLIGNVNNGTGIFRYNLETEEYDTTIVKEGLIDNWFLINDIFYGLDIKSDENMVKKDYSLIIVNTLSKKCTSKKLNDVVNKEFNFATNTDNYLYGYTTKYDSYTGNPITVDYYRIDLKTFVMSKINEAINKEDDIFSCYKDKCYVGFKDGTNSKINIYDNDFKLLKALIIRDRITNMVLSNNKLFVLSSAYNEATKEYIKDEYLYYYDINNNFNLIKKGPVQDVLERSAFLSGVNEMIPME